MRNVLAGLMAVILCMGAVLSAQAAEPKTGDVPPALLGKDREGDVVDLAQHRGKVSLQEVTADGVVVLRFGGGCHGCGMADVTLKQGIEKTLMEKVPGVTAVRDATDHATGDAPYIPSKDVPRDAA